VRLALPLLSLACVEYSPARNVDPPRIIPDGWVQDAFEGTSTSSVDVVVFADTSGSMTDELVTLGQTVQPFVERLAERVDDWQLAAVTGDTGCAVSGILTPNTPDYADRFAVAIVLPVGSEFSAEMGLQNVTLVVENSGPGTCNEGLVRGGTLHAIFVTDENEESPGYDRAPDYWRDWFDRMADAHGDPSQVQLSAVAGPTPNGCFGADPAFGYDAAVAATGGEFLSICDDWASQIDIIADTVGLQSRFELTHTPVESTIQVWVDDDETDFTYEVAANTIVLDEPLEPGATLIVLYQPQ
jgi:hypothetical protein